MLKRIAKNNDKAQRTIALNLVDQMFGSELITGVQIKESFVKILSNIDADSASVSEMSAWAVLSDKLKLSDVAEITEGGSTYPMFFTLLQMMAASNKDVTMRHVKEQNIKLIDQLPADKRTEEQLGNQLEKLELSFLVPHLAIKADMWRQLESNPDPTSFLKWINDTIPEKNRKEVEFVSALIATIMKHICESTTLKNSSASVDKEDTDKERAKIEDFKNLLSVHLANPELQLAAVYALQVFAFSRSFPKGLLLRWFVALYEADIVDERVFLKWKEDVNDTYPGKGKALFQVNQWLTWLEEAESEEEDEDEE